MFAVIFTIPFGVQVYGDDVNNGTGYGKHLQWVNSFGLRYTGYETQWSSGMSVWALLWAYFQRWIGDAFSVLSWFVYFPWYFYQLYNYFNAGGNFYDYSWSTAYANNVSSVNIF